MSGKNFSSQIPSEFIQTVRMPMSICLDCRHRTNARAPRPPMATPLTTPIWKYESGWKFESPKYFPRPGTFLWICDKKTSQHTVSAWFTQQCEVECEEICVYRSNSLLPQHTDTVLTVEYRFVTPIGWGSLWWTLVLIGVIHGRHNRHTLYSLWSTVILNTGSKYEP